MVHIKDEPQSMLSTPQTQSTPGITISSVIARSQATWRSQPPSPSPSQKTQRNRLPPPLPVEQPPRIHRQESAGRLDRRCRHLPIHRYADLNNQQISLLFKPLNKSSISQMRRRFRIRLESEPDTKRKFTDLDHKINQIISDERSGVEKYLS